MARGNLAAFVTDLLPDLQTCLEVLQRRLVIPSGTINLADVVEGRPFAAFVADLLIDLQTSLQVLQRRLVIPSGMIICCDVVEGRPFAAFVADLLILCERFFIKL
jgi:hypothetical protein